MDNERNEVIKEFDNLLSTIDRKGGFLKKLLILILLSLLFLILSVVTLIMAPYAAYVKSQNQKQKGI